ncbi:SDR family oxidoreductase [Herbiconiux daphne]|uniref:SDR family oxidoreductase n=1 Tax=Herbiconiux daphne TaxID=2970914 RepID=A0ABT2H485_9MICO|nr:SDR family oxidoreductase [Herbiconiux daphne]MCS5734727.1 SDR family oxidoreductase [Herbiconiux daphne]
MNIVVVGGTGLIGKNVIKRLTALGHTATAASPNTGVNTLAGEGLDEALTGAEVVVDVTNSPSFAPADVMHFFTTSTANQLAAERRAGVGHHVALSIVGVERPSDGGYFQAKAAQETLIRESGQPFTIVHATQFFEFIGAIADTATSGTTVTLPPVAFQPVAADDVAAAVTRAAVGAPVNGIVEIAGPERAPFDRIVARVLQARGDERTVVADPAATYFGAHVDDTSLVPESAPDAAGTTLEAWLAAGGATPAPAR